jgi:hypothetical protein
MSRQRNDDSLQSDFSKWLYEQAKTNNLFNHSNIDIDTFYFSEKHQLFIEVKTYYADMSEYQREALEWLHNHLTGSAHPTFKGVHCFRFQKTRPDNGDTIIKSFDGLRWRDYMEEISSSIQVNKWLIERSKL